MNGRYLRELGTDELTRRLEAYYGRDGLGPAVAISEEKIQTLADFWPLAGFIFDGPVDDPKARAKVLNEAGIESLAATRDELDGIDDWTTVVLDERLRALAEARDTGLGKFLQPIRVALSGTTVSPGIFETLDVLGREDSLRRIDAALAAGPASG